MDDELLDEITSEILGQFGGEHDATRRARTAARDILVLFERELTDATRSTILDMETRRH